MPDNEKTTNAQPEDSRETASIRIPAIRPTDDTLEMKTGNVAKADDREKNDEQPDAVEVRFERDAWHVTGKAIDDELVFNELADAERRAMELSSDLHIGVIVYGEDDSIVARYAAK